MTPTTEGDKGYVNSERDHLRFHAGPGAAVDGSSTREHQRLGSEINSDNHRDGYGRASTHYGAQFGRAAARGSLCCRGRETLRPGDPGRQRL